jgi:di/tricarboxylate transporter
MSDITILLLIIVGAVVLFVTNRVPVVATAVGVALALFFTGILSIEEAVSGFGDPTVIFIASLFIVSGALEATGVTAWAGQWLINTAGTDNPMRLKILMMLLVAGLTALISVNGAVAALLPVVVVLAVRTGTASGQLLIPLVFAAHAGSMLALSGTPVNVLVSDALMATSGQGFGYFEFALAGIPLLAGGMAILLFLGPKLLPHSSGANLPPDFSAHARTLVEHYRLTDGLIRLRLREESALIGTATDAIGSHPAAGLTMVAIDRGDGAVELKSGGETLRAGDALVVRGSAEAAVGWASEVGLAIIEDVEPDGVKSSIFNRNSGLAEVMVPPRSALVGRQVHAGMTNRSGDLVVLAVTRAHEELPPGPITLQQGDTLLLQGTWDALERRLGSPEVVVVNDPDTVRRQAVPLGLGAKGAIAALLLMVALLVSGVVPTSVAGMVAAMVILVTGILSVDQAYRAINWTTVILVGAMTPLSLAMFQTGAADLLAESLIRQVGDADPRMLLVALFLITAVLGQIISNMATALIMIPVAVMASAQLGIPADTVLMSLTIAAAAAFLTPIATPVNLMVLEPGGYKFTDYWKLGAVMMLWFFIIAVFWVPFVWGI